MKNSWEPGAYGEEWFRNLHFEQQELFKKQDQERIAAHNAVDAGAMTKEAFVELCVQQAKTNLAQFATRTKSPFNVFKSDDSNV